MPDQVAKGKKDPESLTPDEKDFFSSKYPDLVDMGGFVKETADELVAVNDELNAAFTSQGADVPPYVIRLIKLIRKAV